MSEFDSDYHTTSSEYYVPDEPPAWHDSGGFPHFEHEYFDDDGESPDTAPDESDVSSVDVTSHYLPEDPLPESEQPARWTRGRIFYLTLVTLFVLILVVYMLVPVIDHFLNPPPPPVLPPPWMA